MQLMRANNPKQRCLAFYNIYFELKRAPTTKQIPFFSVRTKLPGNCFGNPQNGMTVLQHKAIITRGPIHQAPTHLGSSVPKDKLQKQAFNNFTV